MIYLLTVAGFYFLVGVALKLGLGVILEAFSTIFQSRIVSWVMLIIGEFCLSLASTFPRVKNRNYPDPGPKVK